MARGKVLFKRTQALQNAEVYLRKRMNSIIQAGVSFAGLSPDGLFRNMRNTFRKEIFNKYGRSKYEPHDGPQACARRKRQLEEGKIFNSWRPWEKDNKD